MLNSTSRTACDFGANDISHPDRVSCAPQPVSSRGSEVRRVAQLGRLQQGTHPQLDGCVLRATDQREGVVQVPRDAVHTAPVHLHHSLCQHIPMVSPCQHRWPSGRGAAHTLRTLQRPLPSQVPYNHSPISGSTCKRVLVSCVWTAGGGSVQRRPLQSHATAAAAVAHSAVGATSHRCC